MSPQLEPDIFRILVVDDNPSIHDDFRKILCAEQSQDGVAVNDLMRELFGEEPRKPHGGRFNMNSAFQGQEALAQVERAEQEGNPFALAFVDVRMPPGWDGIETIRQVWSRFPQVQMVICTAYSDYSWDKILESVGDTDSLLILKKPFDNVEVLQLAYTLTKKWLMTRMADARLATLDECIRQRTLELVEANRQLKNEVQRRSSVESALRESEARFHQAFEIVSVPLAISSLETGRFRDVNHSFLELTGYTDLEILGHTAGQLRLLVDPAIEAHITRHLRGGQHVRNLKVALRCKHGEIRQTLASVELLKLGEQSCSLAAFQDVTPP